MTPFGTTSQQQIRQGIQWLVVRHTTPELFQNGVGKEIKRFFHGTLEGRRLKAINENLISFHVCDVFGVLPHGPL